METNHFSWALQYVLQKTVLSFSEMLVGVVQNIFLSTIPLTVVVEHFFEVSM